MSQRGSWHAWTETEWKDEVAPEGEDLGRLDQDLESFLSDIRDMAQTVVECTVEPLAAFAESLPRAMAFEGKDRHRAWASRARRSMRDARRRWAW
jgi:hypothetical protein